MVCEGAESEPNYINGIRRAWRVTTAHWYASPSGSGPEKVVEYAQHKAQKERSWDEVYCIFDRDIHAHYQEALRKARELDGKLSTTPPTTRVRFSAIPSIPSFELWFLLHFQPLTREEDRHVVLRMLKGYVPNYDKALKDMFERTFQKLDIAYNNAEEERQNRKRTGNDNPSTDMDILVKRLFAIGEMYKLKFGVQ